MERARLTDLVRGTGAATDCGRWVFLRDPHWTPAQAAAFADHLEAARSGDPAGGAGWLCIPTGGSSGGLKFARHDEDTLSAAVRGFCTHFSLEQVNAVDVLPPWHVSGLMARVRSAATGGRHLPWAWKQLEAGARPAVDRSRPWMLSLVPTQLQRLLDQPDAVDWLAGLSLILLGGAPAWPGLVDAAVAAGLPIALSYGMTETAAMICAQRAGDAAAGDRSSGRALPHARIEVVDERDGAPLGPGAAGRVVIRGESVMRGYFGEAPGDGAFATADRGRIDEAGRLTLLGRRDDVIISGGEKVNPSEIEAVLRDTGLFDDLAVIGLAHAAWGEEVVACYRRAAGEVSAERIEQGVGDRLLRHQRPKRWLYFSAETWPRNAQGKVNRAELRSRVSALRDPRG